MGRRGAQGRFPSEKSLLEVLRHHVPCFFLGLDLGRQQILILGITWDEGGCLG